MCDTRVKQALTAPTKNTEEGAVPSQINPKDPALLKTWKEGCPEDQRLPKWKGPYKVTLTTSAAVKLQGVSSWVRLSRLKLLPPETPQVKTDEQYTSGRSEIPIQKPGTINR